MTDGIKANLDDSFEAQSELARELRRRGSFQEALRSCEAAIKLDPGNPAAHYLKGTILESMGVEPLAMACFTNTLKLKRDHPKALRSFVRLAAQTPDWAIGSNLRAILLECLRQGLQSQELAKLVTHQLERDHDLSASPMELLRSLATDPLMEFLTHLLNTSATLELALTHIRRQLLRTEEPSEQLFPAAISLARQCFLNEYVFSVTSEEDQEVERLIGEFKLEGEDAEWDLVRLTMYRSPTSLPFSEELAGMPRVRWSEPVLGLLEVGLLEPREEIELRSSFESLSEVRDLTSRVVREQYEENPYPRWVSPRMPHEPGNLGRELRQRFPQMEEPELLEGAIEVLVPGCGTGRQPISLAMRYPHARVLAVDLSLSSLAYARRMAQKLEVRNLEFLHGDLLDLPKLGRRFHYVSCLGVIHHMADPHRAWRTLVEVLRPRGVLYLGTYSELRRKRIAQARKIIARRDFKPVPEDIRALRREILGGDFEVDVGESSRDFYSMSSCRDLLFHTHEDPLTIDRIQAGIQDFGLRFLGFLEFGNAAFAKAYRQRFPQDPTGTDLELWKDYEDHLTNRMGYFFWSQRI